MKTYRITAEHTKGRSVGHPCTKGVFPDPTDFFEATIQADNEAEAEAVGKKQLETRCQEAETCDCQRRLRAGSESWWDSVAIVVEEGGDS